MRILHMSDFHIKDENISQDLILSSLGSKIEELNKQGGSPDMLIITGDIAYSGQSNQYLFAKEFIDQICRTCSLEKKDVIIIPGNHDVDRGKIEPGHKEWWYEFKDENGLENVISSDLSFPKVRSTTDAYFEFHQHYANGTEIGKFGEFVVKTTIDESEVVLSIIGLNSALFCGYDGDDQGKLALCLSQVTACAEKIDREKEVVITCLHHPEHSFHSCDKPSHKVVDRVSDIVLSGHVHEPENVIKVGGNSGKTVYITAGAGYLKRTSHNAFNMIEIDGVSMKGKVTFYKYMPNEHDWIINKDINHATNGVFQFDFEKEKEQNPSSSTVELKSEEGTSYMVVLDGKIGELDRQRFEALQIHLRTIFKDLNVTITKVEESSIKIYFNSINELSDKERQDLTKIDGYNILEIKKSKAVISEIVRKKDQSVFHWNTFLKPEFYENIENPGATFTHSKADDLTLEDLFVPPNVKILSIGEDSKSKVEKVISSNEALSKEYDTAIRTIIYGSEQSGKTTLLRWWYDKYYELGYVPILLSGNDINSVNGDKLSRIAQREFENQYEGTAIADLKEYDPKRVIVIIDDFHKVRFKKSKYKGSLILNLKNEFSNLIIAGNDLMQYESYSSHTGASRSILEDFDRYSILEFGPTLRYELVKKWNSIGNEGQNSNDLIRLNKETEGHVESIIGKNFVPSFPIYILTILQAREASSSQNPEYSIHGFYYEILINDALNNAVKSKSDISLYYNVITEYCYFLFDNRIRLQPISIDSFETFYKQYQLDYKIPTRSSVILETLVKSKLVHVKHGLVEVAYKYVYYFFVARYLANNISVKKIKQKITLLCERVYRDEFSSIVMFLTHLSKDQFILDELVRNSKSLFNGYEPIKLENDVVFINEMIKKLPEQIYEPIDIDTIKKEELEEEELLEKQSREFDAEKDLFEYQLDEDISSLDSLSRMIRAMKTIEILGQVTKKYWGELKGRQKYDLAEETYMLGLRTLGFYYSLIENDTEMLIEYLNHIYKKRHNSPSISKREINAASRNYLFGICMMSTIGIIKRVSNSIGYDKLSGTFEDLSLAHDYHSVKLIDTSIKLDHNTKFPWSELGSLKKEVDNNYLAKVVLRNLVIDYLYVFVTSVSDKQKICALMDIKMKQQRMIDSTSSVKKES